MPPHQFVDYYRVLGITPVASAQEIRRAFHRLVLKAHPDKNPQRTEWSERKVRELIRAYDVLGDREKRSRFDVEYRARRRHVPKSRQGAQPFFFKRSDPRALALRILYYLLNNRGADALALLKRIEQRRGPGFLREELDRGDYLDCLFLLGEHHIQQREYREALDRMRAFYVHERGARYPRHYLGSVVDHLKDLYLRKIPQLLPPEEALALLREAAGMDLGGRERLLLERLVEGLESKVAGPPSAAGQTGKQNARGA